MQLSNIQENLAKTELVQRLQQIMQDAARAAQAAHTAQGDERTREAQEQVADTQQTEHEAIREGGGRGSEGGRRRRRRRKSEEEEAEVPERGREPPSSEGRIIDVTI